MQARNHENSDEIRAPPVRYLDLANRLFTITVRTPSVTTLFGEKSNKEAIAPFRMSHASRRHPTGQTGYINLSQHDHRETAPIWKCTLHAARPWKNRELEASLFIHIGTPLVWLATGQPEKPMSNHRLGLAVIPFASDFSLSKVGIANKVLRFEPQLVNHQLFRIILRCIKSIFPAASRTSQGDSDMMQ